MFIKNNHTIVAVVHTCVNGGTRPSEVEEVRHTIGQHGLARSRGLVQLSPVEVSGHDICVVAAGRAHEDGGAAPDELLEGDARCGGEFQHLKERT